MLTGQLPFVADTKEEIQQLILHGDKSFIDDLAITSQAKDLIKQMLVNDPVQRISSKKALAHPWFEFQKENSQKIVRQKTTVISKIT